MRDPTAIRSPVVVFEVLSPGTEGVDRNQKANMYRACPAIQAYVLIDQQQTSVEVYLRVGVFWQHFLYNAPDALVDLPPLDVQIPMRDVYRNVVFTDGALAADDSGQ